MISRSVFAFTLLAIVLAAGWLMRFDMRAVGGAGGVYILDRWTGEVRHCQLDLCTAADGATIAKNTPPNIFDKFDGEPVLENRR